MLVRAKEYGFRLVRFRQRPLKQSHERRVDKHASKQSIEALILLLFRLM